MNHTIYSNSKHKTIQKLKNKNILHWGFTVKGQGEELSPGNPSDITIRRSEANRLKVVVFIWESCFWCHLEEKRDKYGSARMKREHLGAAAGIFEMMHLLSSRAHTVQQVMDP